MSLVRVYLHDLAYKQDAKGFLKRLDLFLAIAGRYHIQTLFVLFASCWDPFHFIGQQPMPVSFRHNLHWVQSPSIALEDTAQYQRLRNYVIA
ncbi:hypothetical protein GGD38_006264 [Chitinophagaceae bacterium OAS944]|nr:hypothetical protein [Chitinophagaceae bacterium OAS944]